MIKQKKKNIGKSVLSIFLALLMALSCLSVIPAFAASTGSYWNGRHWFKTDGDNRYAFCINASAESGSSLSVSDKAWTYYNKFGADKRAKLMQIFTVADSKGMLDAKTIPNNDKKDNPNAVIYSTVQRAVWETLGQYSKVATSFYTENTENWTELTNNTTYANLVKTPSFGSFGSNLKLDAVYDSNNVLTGYSKTFTDKNNALANYSITSEDGLTVTKSGNKITVSCGKDGFDNTKKITLTNNKAKSFSMTKANLYMSGSQEVLAAGSGHAITSVLTVSLPGTSVPNPVVGGLRITKIDETGAKLSGIPFQIESDYTGNNDNLNSYNVTNAYGVIEYPADAIKGPPVYQPDGTTKVNYTITEVDSGANYVAPVAQVVVQLTENTVIDVNNYRPDLYGSQWVNLEKRGDCRMAKTVQTTGADGKVSSTIAGAGFTFHIYGTSNTGLPVDAYSTTGADGYAYFCDMPIGNYTIAEVNCPLNYVPMSPWTCGIIWDGNNQYDVGGGYVKTNQNTANIASFYNRIAWTNDDGTQMLFDNEYHFTNLLKQWNAVVTKSDNETTIAQGDATLSGAIYTLYRNGIALKDYTTDANGQFITDYYTVEGTYTLKEKSPSNGYLLNDTVYTLNTNSANMGVLYNTITSGVTESVIKNNISIVKYSQTAITGPVTNYEVGAEFQIYLTSAGTYDNAKTSEKDILTTDDKGVATSKDLPYGTYTVHQTKAGAECEDAEFCEDFTVTISEDKSTSAPYYRYINNMPLLSYVSVTKTDATTGKTIALDGAGFKIYATKDIKLNGKVLYQKGDAVSFDVTYPTQTKVDTFYTDVNGKLITPSTLPAGSYQLVEVQAPNGYKLNATPQDFTISRGSVSDTTIGDNDVKIINLTQSDTQQTGKITITKTGEVFSSVDTSEDVNTPVFTYEGLKGAVYNIVADNDITTGDGTTYYHKGDVVQTLTTDKNGVATTKDLYLGDYSIIEVTAPHGYTLNNDVTSISLTYNGELAAINQNLADTNVNRVNDRQKVTLDVTKQLENDELYNIGMNDEYQNVKFGVFATEAITASNGDTIDKDNLITIGTLNKDGKVVFDVDLPLDYQYYIKEIATDKHYLISDKKYDFDTDYDDSDKQSVATIKVDIDVDTNKLIRGSVKGLKSDDEGYALANAKFGLYSTDMKTLYATSVSSANGVFGFTNIPYGEYVVKEITAPIGHLKDDSAYPVSITSDKQAVKVRAVNQLIRGSVVATKIDKDYPQNRLTGATFRVYNDVNNNGIYDASVDTIYGDLTETETGFYQLNQIPYGNYLILEKSAPYGFVVDSTAYPFSITENCSIINMSNDVSTSCFINAPQEGKINIVKTSDDGVVSNVKFHITGTTIQGQTIDTYVFTDKNGNYSGVFRYGNYHIDEICSKKYVTPDSYDVVVNANGTAITAYKADTYASSAKTIGKKSIKKTKITSKKSSKKSITIKWKKLADVKSYKIQYSTSKKFTKKTTKTITVKGQKTTKKTIKGLKSGTKYYVRVCGVNGKAKGSYSAVKSIKTK